MKSVTDVPIHTGTPVFWFQRPLHVSSGDLSKSTVIPPSTQTYFLFAIGKGGEIPVVCDQQKVSLPETHLNNYLHTKLPGWSRGSGDTQLGVYWPCLPLLSFQQLFTELQVGHFLPLLPASPECVQNAGWRWTSPPVSSDRVGDFKSSTPEESEENKTRKICLATNIFPEWLWLASPLRGRSDSYFCLYPVLDPLN